MSHKNRTKIERKKEKNEKDQMKKDEVQIEEISKKRNERVRDIENHLTNYEVRGDKIRIASILVDEPGMGCGNVPGSSELQPRVQTT